MIYIIQNSHSKLLQKGQEKLAILKMKKQLYAQVKKTQPKEELRKG